MRTTESLWTVGDYTIFGQVALGSFFRVFAGIHNIVHLPVTIEQFAVSALRSRDVGRWRGIVHQHVAEVFEVLQEGDFVYVVTSHAHQNLSSALLPNEPLGEDRARQYFREIAAGLGFLHSRLGIAHGGLTTDSIFLRADGHIELFNVAINELRVRRIDDGLGDNLVFTAPELHCGRPGCLASDMWSLGVVLVLLITSRSPFAPRPGLRMLAQVCRGEVLPPPELSTEAGDLVRRLLERDPECRIAIGDVLRHPWLRGAVDVDPLVRDTPLDLKVLRRLTDCGLAFDIKQLKDAVAAGEPGPLVAAYRLVRRHRAMRRLFGAQRLLVSGEQRIDTRPWVVGRRRGEGRNTARRWGSIAEPAQKPFARPSRQPRPHTWAFGNVEAEGNG
jgi:serine/threonine protein kinase